MISARDRRKAVELVTEAVAAGARAIEALQMLGHCLQQLPQVA